MVAAFTTEDLVTRVWDDLTLPASEGRLGSTTAAQYANVLRKADRVMRQDVSRVAMAARQGIWLASADVAITSGTSLYSLPPRAHGETIEDLLIVDAGGDPAMEWSAPEIDRHNAYRYIIGRGHWDSPYGFTWRDNQVELLPHPTETRYTLRVLYASRPSRLVTTDSCAVVASTTATTITTVATTPTAFGASAELDLVSAQNGRHHGTDAAGTSIGGTSITIAAGVPSDLVAGDYVCLAGETPVPPVSEPLFDVLVDGASLMTAQAILDPEDVNDALMRLQSSHRAAMGLTKPRSRGSTRRLVPHFSPFRRGRRR